MLLLSGVSGCRTTPVREEKKAAVPQFQVSEHTVGRRAGALRKVLAPMKIRGVGVSLSAYRAYKERTAEIVRLVKQLGFNRIYCAISSEAELSDELVSLVTAAADSGIPVELTVRQGDFKHRFRGNAFIRSILPQFRTLPDLAAEIVEFNAGLPENAKLAGVSVRFEPHLFTVANGADLIPGLHYIWSEHTFGLGMDNDNLVITSIKLLEKMKKNLRGIPLRIELPDFYPVWAREKKLSRGRVQDFSGFDGVIIQSSGNRPREAVRRLNAAAAGTRNNMAVIQLAGHTSVRDGALRRRDWNDFVRSAGFIVNSMRKMNCSGVVLRPLSELGFMLLEQD